MGYLTIEFDAKNGEKMLNKALSEKIHIWNLRCHSGKITGNISIKNFYKLRKIKRGIDCKIKILRKSGLVFKTKKYQKRSGFAFGFFLYCVILILLSNFVWIINVEGNEKISDYEIIKACEKIGITEGVLKNRINNKYDAQRLQLIKKGIAWCSITVEGSVLTVNLSETAISDKEERETPSNIKASFDGKISKINVASGDVKVRVGDVVAKGDLLVSGVSDKSTSTVFIHSEGEVVAETIRTFSAEGRFVQNVLKPNGEKITRKTVEFFGIKIPMYLGNIDSQNIYSKKTDSLKLFSKKIPIKTATEYYEILEEVTVIYDNETLENLLYEEIQEQVQRFDFISISEKNREVIETKDGMLLKIEYLCEENIAVQDDILLHTEN